MMIIFLDGSNEALIIFMYMSDLFNFYFANEYFIPTAVSHQTYDKTIFFFYICDAHRGF